MSFDAFLHTNVQQAPGRAVRESDLYGGLKHYCQRVGITCPTWQEYHRLLKVRHANKRVVEGKMIITEIGWKNSAEDRPVDAQDYILSETVVIEEQAEMSEGSNKQLVVFEDSPPWEEQNETFEHNTNRTIQTINSIQTRNNTMEFNDRTLDRALHFTVVEEGAWLYEDCLLNAANKWLEREANRTLTLPELRCYMKTRGHNYRIDSKGKLIWTGIAWHVYYDQTESWECCNSRCGTDCHVDGDVCI